ncbi:MAG: response regulator transcription factor [Halobacteriaceae archaeon]
METDGARTVLLVDDETALRELYESILDDTFDVVTAAGSGAALELVDESIDVALLDRRMPEMSGDELLLRLRESGYEMPVGMVSALKPDRDIVELPLDDYLAKPVHTTELLERTELLVLRTHLDRPCRELFRLAAKKSALEAGEGTDAEGTEAIRELVARMESLQERVDPQVDHLRARDIAYPSSLETLPDAVWDACQPPEQTT